MHLINRSFTKQSGLETAENNINKFAITDAKYTDMFTGFHTFFTV